MNFLQGDYLPTHQLSADQSREFCDALRADSKLFRNYFKVSMDNFTLDYINSGNKIFLLTLKNMFEVASVKEMVYV